MALVRDIIFDVDGTLVDSVDEHAEAWRRAFLEFGRDVPFAHVRSQIGKGADQLMPVFFTEDELEKFGQELSDYRSELFKREFMPKLRPFPKVREHFEREWYWSSEPQEPRSQLVWGQNFTSGIQTMYGRPFRGRARAVRRLPDDAEAPAPAPGSAPA